MEAIEIIVAKLTATSAVTAITTAQGIQAIDLPQTWVPPGILCNLVTASDLVMADGAAGMNFGIVQLSLITVDKPTLVTLAAAVKAALADVGNATIAGQTNVSIKKGAVEFTDPVDDRSCYRHVIDFSVRWK